MATTADKGKIITAAWELLAEVGVTQFSMRKLAKKVGITASTLYWHFSSKEAIFLEMVDEVCGAALNEFKVEPTWQKQLVSDGMVFAQALRARPFSAELLFLTPPQTKHFLQVNEFFLRTVEELNFSDLEKMMTINLYINSILTFERDRQLHQENRQNYPQNVNEAKESATNVPVLTRMFSQGIFNQIDRPETLEWSLKTLVAGLEKQQKRI